MRFSVCIPATRPSTLTDAIRSVLAQREDDWELVVVGQGDHQALSAAVESVAGEDPRVRYLRLDARGLSRARNAGIDATTGEFIALLDDDCEAAPDWLSVIASCFADPDLGLVGGSLVAPVRVQRIGTCPEKIVAELVYDPSETADGPPENWDLVGGNLAIRRTVAAAIGGFDDYLGAGTDFGGAEEFDYLMRVEREGAKMRLTPRSVVHHTHGWRYGVSAIYRLKKNYARGNGALAAKLTLLGGRRGQDWVDADLRRTRELLRIRSLHRLPAALMRLWHFRRAYSSCLRGYEVHPQGDPVRGVLAPVA